MLKKKNIATMMAVATVATSVAPVFAAETEADVLQRVKATSGSLKKGQDETNQLIDDLRFLLNEGSKFEVVEIVKDGEVKQAHYTTQATVNSSTEDSDADDATIIEKGTSVYTIVMNGKEVKSIVEVENAINALKSSSGQIGKLELKLIDKGHALVDGKVSAFNGREQDIQSTTMKSITVYASDANTTVLNVEDLYDGEYLTQSGFELYNAVQNKSENLLSDEEYTITLKSEYQDAEGNYIIKVEEGDNKKEQTIKFELNVDYVDSSKEDEIHNIEIVGKDLAHTAELADFLNETAGYELGVSRLAGEDRFKTAVKIAKETSMATVSTDDNNGENVVLVNAESMIDGLTATPLAQVLNAPVLLTNKDEVQVDTLDYIKELNKIAKQNGKVTKVTIVGGEGVVSEAVVRQLEKLGIEVERIGGEDRHATSVEVGIKMRSLNANLQINDAFIVAATGEADAMSIAPVAADLNAPIIVEGFNGMSTTAKELLKNAKENKSVDIIGGQVSEETQEFYAKSGDFVYGETRHETNAKVVEKYCEDAEYIYVAKDGYVKGNAQLVDALAVGSLAKAENAAIILATDSLSTRQKEAIKSVAADNAEIKQIGGGVNFSNVIKNVAKVLGFTK